MGQKETESQVLNKNLVTKTKKIGALSSVNLLRKSVDSYASRH